MNLRKQQAEMAYMARSDIDTAASYALVDDI